MSELTAALAKAQGEFPVITKNREVNAGPRRYKYAELATILAAVTPVLAKNGLAVTQRMDITEHGTVLLTDLRHVGGEIVSSCLPLHMDNLQPQALGSLLTYLKRYSLASLLNVAADEDDDAHVAQEQPKSSDQRQTRQPPKPNGKSYTPTPTEAVDAAIATQAADPLHLGNAKGATAKRDLLLIGLQQSDKFECDRLWAIYRDRMRSLDKVLGDGEWQRLDDYVVGRIAGPAPNTLAAG